MRKANLQHASMIQTTLVGADLSGANLSYATLTQAEAEDVKLAGANLSNAHFTQATLTGADMSGANLSGADFGQATLTGADMSRANLSGTSFTEADLGGAKFKGATGVAPWSLYLLIASGVIFVLLMLGTVRRMLRGPIQRGMAYANAGMSALGAQGFPNIGNQGGFGNQGFPNMGMPGGPTRRVRPPGVVLIRGLIGALVVAIGFHLFAGGLIDQIVGSFGPPLAQLCTGPLCKVGVASGFAGLFAGVFVALAGFGIRATGR